MPTAPGVLFANFQDIHNLGRTVGIQSVEGGPATPAYLQPGENPAVTFGIGFALNDRAALTFSYQQEHVFTAYENHQAIAGSPYSFGTFNFGLGYQLTQSTRLNLSVGIGAGQNAPVAKVLLELPYQFAVSRPGRAGIDPARPGRPPAAAPPHRARAGAAGGDAYLPVLTVGSVAGANCCGGTRNSSHSSTR